MTFEEKLREKIKSYAFSAPERTLLKVVLGELQQQAPSNKDASEVGYSVVKKIIKANEENLGHLDVSDARFGQYTHENEVLADLLPKYLSADEIRESLTAAGIDFKSMPEGQATGKAMLHFKTNQLPVDGHAVKAVVIEMRQV